MPSSLTWVLSNASVFSTCPPESVCGTVTSRSSQPAAFLGSMESITSARRPRHHLSESSSRFVPTCSSYRLTPGQPALGHQLPHTTSVIRHTPAGARIFTCFPSTTPFGLALGAGSPCADERCAGNLGLSASGPSTRFIATHVSIRTSHTSGRVYTPPSQAYGTLSYHPHKL